MLAHRLWLMNDIIAENKVIFKIPVYQRNYDWSEANVNRLLDDIEIIIDTGRKHFLGTIVYISANEGGVAIREYMIIDGQQRLTSMMILLKALADVAKDLDPECSEEIYQDFLCNKRCEERFKIKLKPIKHDNDQFVALLEDHKELLDKAGHIYCNYQICYERFKKWLKNGREVRQISDALYKLEIVDIVLDPKEDDPQIIFESINSTGLDLTNADLIRNFLLMDAPNQVELYEHYWLKIEGDLKKGTDYTDMNEFFQHYIIYKTGKLPKFSRIYDEFVLLYKDSKENYDQEKMLKELKYYTKIYKSFIGEDDHYGLEVTSILKKIRNIKQTTPYPFLFRVFDDYENGVIDLRILAQILHILLIYLVRRTICEVSSSYLRGFFVALYQRVFKSELNKKKYAKALSQFLYTLTSRDQMPSEERFKSNLLRNNLYAKRLFCKLLLSEIENGDNKEVLDMQDLTIEHLMPQKLSRDWMSIASKDHEAYLHVLGNLTITGYNSELSNKSFEEKKEIIRSKSRAILLNSDVVDKEKWGIPEIQARSERLAQLLCERFYLDNSIDPTIEFEDTASLSLDQADEVTGKKLIRYKYKNRSYSVSQYKQMLVWIARQLDKESPETTISLAQAEYTRKYGIYLKSENLNRKEFVRRSYCIRDDIYMHTDLSASDIITRIRMLFTAYRVPISDFQFYVKLNEAGEDDEED